MSFESKIETFVDCSIRKNNLLGKILILLRKIGFTQTTRKIWIRFIYFKESIHPTQEILEAQNYYKLHREEVEFNKSLLSDDISKEIYQSIIDFRCTHKLSTFPKYNLKNQYFDKDIVPKKENYIFIDGGSYTGDTLENFFSFSDNLYEKIICFEPDTENLIALKNYIKGKNNIYIIDKGMWSQKSVLHFSMDQTASKITSEGEVAIEVTNIDSEEICKDANFIKMDIEGAELDALEGAINTIKRNKPVLAICIYHSNEDMIRIIQWIHNLNLDYSLYIRHHSFDIHETVLYAIPKNSN